MRPIIIKGHERPLTQVKFNKEGDLLFSTARDQIASVWFSHNGERLGTLQGHGGAIFTIDVDPTSTNCLTGAADNSMKLWHVETGRCIFTWETKATARFVEISPDSKSFLAVTEEHMGQRGTIFVFPLNVTTEENAQDSEPVLVIKNPEGHPKVSYAIWDYTGDIIIAGHVDGSISKFSAETGEQLINKKIHDGQITDLQASADKSYFITSSRDKSAHLVGVDDFEVLKTYEADTAMNSAAITQVKDFVILGGGQDARDVTTTSSREGKFEGRFYHKIFEDEIGRVKGHFGPINTIAAHPKGIAYASGGEDGYVRVHHFDKSYFDFLYDVERTAQAQQTTVQTEVQAEA